MGPIVIEYLASVKSFLAAGCVALMALPSLGYAAEFGDQASGGYDIPYVDELRLGGYYTNPDQAERGALVQIEAVFSQFITHDFGNTYVNAVLLPRIHVGANINVTGDTSAGYAGLTWQFPVYGPLFLEGTFGGAVHNGELDNAPRDRQQLGCPILFRESGSIGLGFEKFSILGTIEHMSNAGFCSENDGLTNVGVRIGYKF